METSSADQQAAALGRATARRIGAALRAARREQGLDQQTLADALDLNRTYLVSLEAGRSTLALDRLVAALDAVGLELVVAPRRPRSTVPGDPR